MGRLRELGGDSQGLNMTKWFEMVSFDILGEMAFGEGFGCVDRGMCIVKVNLMSPS